MEMDRDMNMDMEMDRDMNMDMEMDRGVNMDIETDRDMNMDMAGLVASSLLSRFRMVRKATCC